MGNNELKNVSNENHKSYYFNDNQKRKIFILIMNY